MEIYGGGKVGGLLKKISFVILVNHRGKNYYKKKAVGKYFDGSSCQKEWDLKIRDA